MPRKAESRARSVLTLVPTVSASPSAYHAMCRVKCEVKKNIYLYLKLNFSFNVLPLFKI